MTISSETRKAGPFTGNDTTDTFPFAFKVFTSSDVLVVRLDTATDIETDLVLDTDYTVTLNANQNASPGGDVVLSANLATGYTLVITSAVENLQPTDLTNQGGFYPKVISDSLDRATIQIQQLQEQIDRAAKAPITSTATGDELGDAIIRLADSADNLDLLGPLAADIDALGPVSADITFVAANIADVTNFADVYQGPHASDPGTRNNGDALQAGDLYFNTTSDVMRVYSGSGWVATGSSVNGTSRRFRYVATAGQTTFTGADSNAETLAYDVGFIDVYLNGSRLDSSEYTASDGTSIVLGTGATLNDELNIVAFGTFDVANIDGANLQAGTVTSEKIDWPLNETQGSNIASAATINLTTSTGNYVHVTGTTGITAITLAEGAERTVVFDGALTITNSASLVLPGGSSITSAAGDTAVFRGEAAGVVRCVNYVRADGIPIKRRLLIPPGSIIGSTTVTSNTIPAWVTRVTITFFGASLSGTSDILVQLKDSTFLTTGYVSSASRLLSASVVTDDFTTGFCVTGGTPAAAHTIYGALTLERDSKNTDRWCASGMFYANSQHLTICAGTLALGGDLTGVRVISANGTDTFDAGQIGIALE